MVCVGNFLCVLWTGNAGLAVLCAGWEEDKGASLPNLLCCCFGDGALRPSKANVSRVHLQLRRQRKLHWARKSHLESVVSVSNFVKFTYRGARHLNFSVCTHASFRVLTSRLPTEEENLLCYHQCCVCFAPAGFNLAVANAHGFSVLSASRLLQLNSQGNRIAATAPHWRQTNGH